MKAFKILLPFIAALLVVGCGNDKGSVPGNPTNPHGPYNFENGNVFEGTLSVQGGWTSFLKEQDYCWHEECKIYDGPATIRVNIQGITENDLQEAKPAQVVLQPRPRTSSWYTPNTTKGPIAYNGRAYMIDNNSRFAIEDISGYNAGYDKKVQFVFSGKPDQDYTTLQVYFGNSLVATATLYRPGFYDNNIHRNSTTHPVNVHNNHSGYHPNSPNYNPYMIW